MFMKHTTMESMKLVTVATLWSENSTTSLPVGPSEAPESENWELVRSIVPPYIFILSLLGLLFNSFVLVVFVAHKDRMTVAEIFLSNLALADFILLCGLPFWAMYILNGFNWLYGDALCKLVNSIIIINFYTSIYTLVMISVDRYLAFVKTMKARGLRRTLYAKVACFFMWILGIILSTPTMVHRKVKFIKEYGTTSCILDYSYESSWKLAHQILLNVVGFVLPVLVIVFSTGNIVRVLYQRRESVFTFLDTLCDLKALDEKRWSHTLNVGHDVSVYLAFVNSTLNPLLYVFSGQYFRRKVSAIYRRTRHHRRGSDMTTYQ
ncbi:hypothetical protein INR49_019858, partial [Caranx melampygus]